MGTNTKARCSRRIVFPEMTVDPEVSSDFRKRKLSHRGQRLYRPRIDKMYQPELFIQEDFGDDLRGE